MTDITRNEMEARFAASDARLDAAEARTNASFRELSSKIDLLTEGLQSVRSEVHEVRTEVRDVRAELRSELREVKHDNKNTRWTIAITVVTAVLAGAGAIWTTQNNLLAAFQAGLARQSLSTTAAAQTVERPPQPATAPVAAPPAVPAGHRH